MSQKIAVIVTIKNEEKTIREFLDALVSQSLIPDEIIITDGGSSDRTCNIITSDYIPRYPFIKLIRENCNIARGRNLAIQSSSSPIIAVTDAGCQAHKDWLKKLTEPLLSDSSVMVTGGITVPDAKSAFEQVTGLFFTVHSSAMRKNPLLVSSRNIAFRKTVWKKTGGYPEWLYLSGEDTLFDKLLLNLGAKFQIIPQAIVYWKPMSGYKKLFSQTFTYARGNGQARLNLNIFYKLVLVYLAFIIIFGLGIHDSEFWIYLILIILAYYSYSAVKIYLRIQKIPAFLLTYPIKFIMDIANLLGFMKGLLMKPDENISSPDPRVHS